MAARRSWCPPTICVLLPELSDEAILLMRTVLMHEHPDVVLQPHNLARAFGLDPLDDEAGQPVNILEFVLEPMRFDFMVRATVTTLIASIVCATPSCWLVLIGWSPWATPSHTPCCPASFSPTSPAHRSPWAPPSSVSAAVVLIGVVRDAKPLVSHPLFALGLVLDLRSRPAMSTSTTSSSATCSACLALT